MQFSPHIGLISAAAGGDQRRRRRFPPAPPFLGGAFASPADSKPAGEALKSAFCCSLLRIHVTRCHATTESLDSRLAAGYVGAARPTSCTSVAKRLSRHAGSMSGMHRDHANLTSKPHQIPPIDVPPFDCYGRRRSSPRRLASPFAFAPIRPFRLHALVACLDVANLARPLRPRKGRGKPFAARKLKPSGFPLFPLRRARVRASVNAVKLPDGAGPRKEQRMEAIEL